MIATAEVMSVVAHVTGTVHGAATAALEAMAVKDTAPTTDPHPVAVTLSAAMGATMGPLVEVATAANTTATALAVVAMGKSPHSTASYP